MLVFIVMSFSAQNSSLLGILEREEKGCNNFLQNALPPLTSAFA